MGWGIVSLKNIKQNYNIIRDHIKWLLLICLNVQIGVT